MAVVITGATSGIGLSLARLYNGTAPLVLIGRRELLDVIGEDADLQTIFTPETYCQVDLASPTCAQTIVAFLEEQKISAVNVLFHNAATAWIGHQSDQSADSIIAMINTNFVAPVAITLALLPYLRIQSDSGSTVHENIHGRIVFFSSVAAWVPSPMYNVYSLTKVGIEGFAKNLAIELQGQPVLVQLIRPPATKTTMHAKVGMTAEQTKNFASADKVANKIKYIAERTTKQTLTMGITNKLLVGVTFSASNWLEGLLAYKHKKSTAGALLAMQNDNPPPVSDVKHCVVTGAAKGIGAAIANRYLEEGYVVTGIDINWEGSEADDSIKRITADLSLQKDLESIIETLGATDPVDVFVHNAGVNFVGSFEDIDISRHLLTIRVNLIAPTVLSTLLASRNLLTINAKHIYISSLARFVTYPGASVYAATKCAVAALSRNLRVAGWNTLTVYPGPTRTQQARDCSPDNSREAKRMTPVELASKIFVAEQNNDARLSPGIAATLMRGVTYTFPSIGAAVMKHAIFNKVAKT